MNYRLLQFVLVSMCLALVFSGCKRPPTPITPTNGPDVRIEADPFRSANESFRYPENATASDDWTRYRDGLQLVTSHFTKPDVTARARLTAKERKFLESDAHLSEAEFAEIETPAFRAADAHYLDECYLLRDVARSLEFSNTPPIEQANYLFRWVARNVFLHEQVDDWIPPAFTLRLGHGGALERSLVFLALLRQARMEGCLIVVPDADPTPMLVAVLEPKTSNLRLFDPRLGLPVMSKDGKSIATLQEALADPTILQPSGITPAQVKKLEVRLVCPLFALAPRMLELQDGLKKHDPITLHMDAPALSEQISKASPLPVKAWNSPSVGSKLTNSPTRCLWMFLPKKEGGVDETQRAVTCAQSRLPFASVIVNLSALNVSEKLMPRQAWFTLLKIAEDLFNKYDLQAHEMLLRGMNEPMVRRLERMRPFVDSPALAGLDRDAAFVGKDVPIWLDELRNAYANLDANNPQEQARAKHAVNAIWGKDLFLFRLIEVDKAEKFEREDKNLVMTAKTPLTKVLAVGTREYFSHELPRLQALANHEKAVRAQALLDATSKPSKDARARAADAWMEAKSSWSIYLGRISLQQKLEQNVQQINLLEGLHMDVQKYFYAKLCLAECLAHADPAGAKAAAKYLEETRAEIESMERRAYLKSAINDVSQQLRQLPEVPRAKFQRRLDLLSNDWSAQGNYYWMKQQIDRRVSRDPQGSAG